MYISPWLIVIILIALYIFYLKVKNTKSDIESAEQIWESANYYKERVFEKSPTIEDYLNDEREMLKVMEIDMMKLRERFKHDPLKQSEYIKDWLDFAKSVKEIKFAREMLDVDWEDNAFDTFEDRAKNAYSVIHEVAKRVMAELGEESHYKVLNERLKIKAEARQDVFKN